MGGLNACDLHSRISLLSVVTPLVGALFAPYDQLLIVATEIVESEVNWYS